MDVRHNLIKLSISLVILLIIFCILFLESHWGLMDDLGNITGLIPYMRERGTLLYAYEYAMRDLAWGMFRPLYPLMVRALYTPGIMFGAKLSFLLNALIAFLSLWTCSLGLARITSQKYFEILIATLCFPYTYDLFLHPSLQEKLILLFGGLLFLSLQFAGWYSVFVFILASTLGFLTKSSFVIFYFSFMFAYLANFISKSPANKKDLLFFLGGIVLGLSLTVYFKILASNGVYTSRYSSSMIFPNMLSVNGLIYLLILSLCLISLLRNFSFRKFLQPNLTPFVGILCFLGVFAPWSIGGYLQSLICVFIGSIIIYFKDSLAPLSLRPSVVTFLCGAAILCASVRAGGGFYRLQDLNRSINYVINNNINEIWSPCEEGSSAMESFFSLAGRQVKVNYYVHNKDINHQIFIYDGKLCPFPGFPRLDIPANCEARYLYKGKFAASFQVVQFNCVSESYN